MQFCIIFMVALLVILASFLSRLPYFSEHQLDIPMHLNALMIRSHIKEALGFYFRSSTISLNDKKMGSQTHNFFHALTFSCVLCIAFPLPL